MAMQQDMFLAFPMKPLHLLYLVSIFNGDFDDRVQRGDFIDHEYFGTRIRELLELQLIKYDGLHYLTPMGAAHVKHLLETKVKVSWHSMKLKMLR